MNSQRLVFVALTMGLLAGILLAWRWEIVVAPAQPDNRDDVRRLPAGSRPTIDPRPVRPWEDPRILPAHAPGGQRSAAREYLRALALVDSRAAAVEAINLLEADVEAESNVTVLVGPLLRLHDPAFYAAWKAQLTPNARALVMLAERGVR